LLLVTTQCILCGTFSLAIGQFIRFFSLLPSPLAGGYLGVPFKFPSRPEFVQLFPELLFPTSSPRFFFFHSCYSFAGSHLLNYCIFPRTHSTGGAAFSASLRSTYRDTNILLSLLPFPPPCDFLNLLPKRVQVFRNPFSF